MKKLIPFLALFVFALQFNTVQAQCSAGRFVNKIFSTKTTTSVKYGSAPNYSGSIQQLYMDIYEPQGDNLANRPLIILAFGGSFTAGVRQSPDLLVLCDEFAKRGYVTATIDYRISSGGSCDDYCMYKSVIRACQDMSAALRFFYADRYNTNKYRIDTSQIFIGGTSAGGFIGLNRTYFKPMSSRPLNQMFLDALVEVGSLNEGNTGNPGYYPQVKGVINLCGAIADTLWLQPGDPMLLCVHGTEDGTVPFYYDSAEAAHDIKAGFFGSGDIDVRCNNIGLNHYVRPLYGADHAPFVIPSTPYLPPSKQYMDTTIQVIRDFLAQNVVCNPEVFSGVEDVNVDLPVLITPGNDQITITSNYNRDLNVKIFDINGRLLNERMMAANEIIAIYKEEIQAGVLMVQLSDRVNPEIRRTEKVVVY